MKMTITKKDYRLLLDLLYWGEWMNGAFESGEISDRFTPYDELIQKLYASAEAMGCSDLVEKSPRSGRYTPTVKFEDSSHVREVIDDYTVAVFWDELLHRLAERDAQREMNLVTTLPNPDKTFWDYVAPYEAQYIQEFSENGLDNLTIQSKAGKSS